MSKLFMPELQPQDRTRLMQQEISVSFADWIAKNDEWQYSSKIGLWKRDGWMSRTTAELYDIFLVTERSHIGEIKI